MPAPYQYVVVREANHKGVVAVQAVHAATEVLRGLPVPKDTRVVLLEAPGSAEIIAISEQLALHGIHHVVVVEPDEPYNGAATALACEPQAKELVADFFAHLKVLR